MQLEYLQNACRGNCVPAGLRPCFEVYGENWTGEGSTCAMPGPAGLNCRLMVGVAKAQKRAREIELSDDAERQSRFPGT